MAVFSMAGSNPALPTYPLQRSVRLRSSAGGYFSRTPATATNRRTFTWSGWVKRGVIGVNCDIFGIRIDGNNQFRFFFNSSNQIDAYNQASATIGARLTTTAVYRDPSAWYHIVLAVDTTNATAGDRMRLYVNGVEVTAFGTDTQPSLNYDTYVNTVNVHNIGNFPTSTDYFDGYLTEVNFIDGQALTPSSFGAYNPYGVWSPTKYTGTYGTNGFYLNFQDNSALTTTANVGIGKDSSGNGNYWTSNNISITAGTTYDSMLDVPTLTSNTNSNYPTLSPIDTGGGSVTLSGGNLNYSIASSTGSQVRGTMGTDLTSKWYFEFTAGSAASPTNPQIFGLSTTEGQITNNSTSLRKAVSAYSDGSTNRNIFYYLNGTLTSNYQIALTSVAIGDILQIAYDAATGKVWFGKNNSWLDASNGTTGNPSAGTNQTVTIATGDAMTPYLANLGATYSGSLNCGQRPFTYTPPTGFNRLCTYNLPDSIVPVGAQYMAATLYTGNASTQTITNTVNGTSMQPDFVWTKSRTQAYNNQLYDSVRGATNWLQSNSTTANQTNATTLTSFNSNGFTVGANDNGNFTNGGTAVGWQWRASNASAVTNTNGALTSQVSVNQTAGFSIVTWTGTGTGATTVGHGLSTLPQFVIIKKRSTTGDWYVASYASGQGLNYAYHLFLNTTGALSGSNDPYYLATQTSLTSNVLSLAAGNPNNGGNESGTTYVAYCWTPVQGFSKFGSYTGNGSADGPFVYLGFRPRWILVKSAGNASQWILHDTSRNTYNVANSSLYPNLSNAEVTPDNPFDMLSNGFKIRTASGFSLNDSSLTYIYAAFAENPFKNSLAR